LQVWTALGRLYAEAEGGVGHVLAATCYLQARSSDPLYARVWEGMAAMAGMRATGEALACFGDSEHVHVARLMAES